MERQDSLSAKIFAADISKNYIQQAQENAKRARVEPHIEFKSEDFLQSTKPSETGIMLANLPYGERLEKNSDLETFYIELGNHLKRNFTGWKIGFLVNEASPWRKIGLKPQKKISLLNGSIKTKLLIFEIYEGSRKHK